MATVTARINEVQQPYGGYLPLKSFKKTTFEDGRILNFNENIHASLIGIAVDYLTRFMMGDTVEKAFDISLRGAYVIGMTAEAQKLQCQITGLDDLSITSACKLAGFDVCYRKSPAAYKPVENINPNSETIENIRIMVQRSMTFWEEYGPIVCSEPTFEGGYTDTVNAGDGDYVSKDTLWDFKVSKSMPTSSHTLQILMYYVMGKHSFNEYYANVTNIGIFNPRLNMAFTCAVSNISTETIELIEKDVICYGDGTSCSKANASIGKPACKSALFSESSGGTDMSEHEDAVMRVYTVADVCRMTGLKKHVIYDDIHYGRLSAHMRGKRYLILEQDYLKYMMI